MNYTAKRASERILLVIFFRISSFFAVKYVPGEHNIK